MNSGIIKLSRWLFKKFIYLHEHVLEEEKKSCTTKCYDSCVAVLTLITGLRRPLDGGKGVNLCKKLWEKTPLRVIWVRLEQRPQNTCKYHFNKSISKNILNNLCMFHNIKKKKVQ